MAGAEGAAPGLQLVELEGRDGKGPSGALIPTHTVLEPPEDQCVSVGKDQSKGDLLPSTGETLVIPSQGHLRSESPDCISMKSDWSNRMPPNFSGEDKTPFDTSQGHLRSESPDCMSMKSDWSNRMPPNFSGEDKTPFDTSQGHLRSESPDCISMKSDWSNRMPPNFSGEDQTPFDTSQGFVRSELPDCMSMKSDWSNRMPPNFSGEDKTPFDTSELRDGLTQLAPSARCAVCEQVLTCPILSLTCGHRFCVDCISRFLDRSGLETTPDCPVCALDTLRNVRQAHKVNLKRRFECINEGSPSPKTRTLLENIYTQLHITEGESLGMNTDHEVRQPETMPRAQTGVDTAINCNDIFKPLPERERHIRTVMTKGIAGIGKTVSVQKFILDWADGNANQDIDFIFVLPFREINLTKDVECSLHGLLLKFHPELRGLRMGSKQYQSCQLVFIFDGLDESQHMLKFAEVPVLTEVTQTSLPNVLITNVIRGNLLPSACVWVTSRPAAVEQIPSEYIHRVTEVRGFTDPQKEEYFRKRISNRSKADRIISHLKSSKSLHIMCHIPVFCWISVTVLQQILDHRNTAIPKTLTEMFIHFLLIQTITKSHKYDEGCGSNEEQVKILESNRSIILKLAKLSFKHLEKGNLMFYEEDLRECGIDIQDAAVYSGMCTEIFQVESLFSQEKVYSFVHVTIQEFLAAFFIFHSYMTKNQEVLVAFLPGDDSEPTSISTGARSLKGVLKRKTTAQCDVPNLHSLLKAAVNKSLQSKNGHLDLFLRFLLGISLDTNQKLLQGLLTHSENTSKSINKTIAYIKDVNETDVSPERYINLFHCLLEMNDNSIHEKIQRFLQSEKQQKKTLSPSQCSALASVLLMSDTTLEELDLRKYSTSDEGRRRLIPAVRCCKKALLADCHLSVQCIELVLSALSLANSPLRELDLSDSHLQDPAAQRLAGQLHSPHCRLNTLRLSSCGLTKQICVCLAPVLRSPSSHLRVLDLSNNQLNDAGAMLISEQLKSEHCKLEILRLSSCHLSEPGCDSLARAVTSKSSHVTELDLRHNHVGQLAASLLIAALQNPHCIFETLGLNGLSDLWLESGPGKYSCELTLDENSASVHIGFSEDCTKVSFLEKPQLYSNHADRFLFWPQVLCKDGLSKRSYWELEWTERADIGVAYKSIARKLEDNRCVLGHNDHSWSLECRDGRHYTAWRNGKKLEIVSPQHVQSNRVGVYLDWQGGALSFYSVSTDMIHHLHTHLTKFSEVLYPGFLMWPKSSVTLCKIRLRHLSLLSAESLERDASMRQRSASAGRDITMRRRRTSES